MEPHFFSIGSIPAALWGPSSERVVVAVHGAQSNKTDVPFQLLSEVAVPYSQVLSLDLPEHGDRKTEPTPCTPPVCVRELSAVMDYAESRWTRISLFAVSMGTYFSLLSCRERELSHAWFLSPVVDMVRLTRDMMEQLQITEARLKAKGTIPTPTGQTLRWDDYCYIRCHPVDRWPFPTDILRGSEDTLCAPEAAADFAVRFHCRIQTAEGSGHWFHTQKDLDALRCWLRETLPPVQA